MAERDILIKEKLDHSGIFNFSNFYSFANLWFKEHNYDGVTEEKYSEKVSGNTKDLVIEWKAVKRMSDFFKIEHTIKFEISGLTEVEVEIDGKKSRTNKGKINIEIKGILVRDPDSKWDSSPFYRFLRDVYSKYIVPGRIEGLEIKTIGDVRDFKEDLKAFFELSGRR